MRATIDEATGLAKVPEGWYWYVEEEKRTIHYGNEEYSTGNVRLTLYRTEHQPAETAPKKSKLLWWTWESVIEEVIREAYDFDYRMIEKTIYGKKLIENKEQVQQILGDPSITDYEHIPRSGNYNGKPRSEQIWLPTPITKERVRTASIEAWDEYIDREHNLALKEHHRFLRTQEMQDIVGKYPPKKLEH